jgi:hypothetical protein
VWLQRVQLRDHENASGVIRVCCSTCSGTATLIPVEACNRKAKTRTQLGPTDVKRRGNQNIPLLDGGDGLTTGDDGGEDVALHGDTKGEGNDIEKQEVSSLGGGGLSGEDTGLDGGTVGNSLIGVDALLELLAVEEVAKELLDLRDTGRTSNENDLVDLGLLDVGVLEDLGNGVKSASEGLLVQVLETSTGDVGVEVLAVEQGVDLNGGLGSVGKGTLGTLASSAETAEGTGIAGDVLATGLLGELLLEVVEEVAVEVLSTEMGALTLLAWNSMHYRQVNLLSGSSLDGEDATLDVQKGDIECTTTEIVDEDVPLLLGLSGAKTVGDSGGSGLVDDTEDVEAGNGTSILGGLTLVVVEVSGDGDDGLLDLHAELGLSNLLHLQSRLARSRA